MCERSRLVDPFSVPRINRSMPSINRPSSTDLLCFVSGNRGFEAPYAVLIYVHGESFEWGGGHPYDGSVLASYGHVIVVTLNFRLGLLGELDLLWQ